MVEEELANHLAGAPLRFRAALKSVKAGADALHDLEALAHTAKMERNGRRPCTLEVRCACRVLALEAQSLGDRHHIWETCAAHVETVAQAACHLASVRAWLAAREKTIDSTEQFEDPQLQRAAYLHYDANKYDFCGLVERMLAEHLPCDGDPERLARLHESTAAQRELGALGCASSWAANGLAYSKELDEATRYGCGIFNRQWKASALREEFMRLFERFVREAIWRSARGIRTQATTSSQMSSTFGCRSRKCRARTHSSLSPRPGKATLRLCAQGQGSCIGSAATHVNTSRP
ncbi:hypothetical protein Ctob_008347 [Chrysochromulina tobinii]|uniref:Uncharacterized protein n=1 Tax=Chrysochromulina tobinii TaxID=1460289 RepID=A0A0M0JNW2_9EUKA|nr:hypothetical protein Ctob_008347 [Chrysochromulina tobinii]|eukprot:KOO28284.1 hypothetical protein Ctob_008347 [Chrysochromulina sp. CCMP291]